MASPPRGRCNSRGKALEETSPGKIRFQRKPDPGPISKIAALNVTIHGYQIRYQPGNVKNSVLLATQNRSLEENLPCQSRLSTIILCLLTIFSVIFSMIPGGVADQKKILHTFRATLKENKLPSNELSNFESFFQ